MRTFRRLCRLALLTWPRDFRARHGAEALRLAGLRVRSERGLRRLRRAAHELLDLSCAGPRIRRETARDRDRAYPTTPAERSTMHEGFLADIRYASRSLLRTRGFFTVAVATLGAGIALCLSVMVVVNAYLVRGLPYPESDRLYSIQYSRPGQPFVENLEKLDWRALDDVIEQPIAWDLDFFNLRGAPYPEGAQGTWVTPGFMEGFGVRPARGRAFEPADFATGAPPVALISHRLWQNRFGGAADVVGRSFEAYVNDRPGEPQVFTIVGVLPDGLWHLNVFTEVMAPLRGPSFPYMARLRRGVTPGAVAARIESLVRAGGAAVPEGWSVSLESAHDRYVEQIRPLLVALATATALVMLIACANVAVLFTVRATQRQHEISVRKALGASAGRVARALAAEAFVLGATATAIGIALAQAVITATAPLLERSLGRSAPGGVAALAIDRRILAGAVLTGLFVTIVCAIAQLWTSGYASPAGALHGGQKGASAGPRQRRAHATLIAVEVAACLTLLVGAALTIESGLRILGVDMGLRDRGVMVGRLNLNQQRYPDAASRNAFYDRVTSGIDALGGAASVGFANSWPLQQAPWRDAGRDEPRGALGRVGVVGVGAAYFETLGIALEEGRLFAAADDPGSERVAIVSRTLAGRLWPGQRAVGQRLRLAPPQGAPPSTPPASYLVVGIVADVRHEHTDNDLADAYLPLRQAPSPAPFMYVRTDSALPRLERDLRELLARLDPDMALVMPRPLSDILDQQRAGPRFLASLLTAFAMLSAVLALVGIYGVIAYTVKQREREIAVRIAIGADRGMITRLFLRQGASVLALGLAMGIGGALLLGRVLQAQLFGVRPADPLAIALVSIPFALCGLVAIGWPARAAAATDPAAALKD